MKFGYAWTFGEAPEIRTPSLPRPPAGLRNSNRAASLQRAYFCVLEGFRIRFRYLERRLDPSRQFWTFPICAHSRAREPQLHLRLIAYAPCLRIAIEAVAALR